jgi:SAM-dependent methyltransferase
MTDAPIRFTNAAAYERYMGAWSQLVGDAFLAWLAPAPGLRWLDVGCGNGAFTEMLAQRCAPAALHGIDPFEDQLAFARSRPALRNGEFRAGDAQALPWPDDSFDATVMPLVIFFLPDPTRGVAEMARVVARGGIVTSYSWDMPGGGFPYQVLQDEMRAIGVPPPQAPSLDASRLDRLQELWRGAGLRDVETRAITVQRTFDDFEDYWATVLGGPSVAARLAGMPAAQLAGLKARMRELLPADKAGRITCTARANAARGIR